MGYEFESDPVRAWYSRVEHRLAKYTAVCWGPGHLLRRLGGQRAAVGREGRSFWLVSLAPRDGAGC